MLLLSNALKAAQAGHQKAAELNIHCGIAVVDAGGNTLVVLRHEQASFLMSQTSQAKAFAAAAFKFTGEEMEELSKTNPHFWETVPSVIDRAVLPTRGSAPIITAGNCVGGVGVGGSTPEQDQEIADFIAAILAKS